MLSIDNAAVLATMVSDLPKAQQNKALREKSGDEDEIDKKRNWLYRRLKLVLSLVEHYAPSAALSLFLGSKAAEIGAIRSFAAAGRRIEREQQRRAREATQQYKQLQKQQEAANAVDAVRQYENYLSIVKSVHQDCSESIDWQAIQELAKACLAKDPTVYQQVLEDFNPFEGVSSLGSRLEFRFTANLVEVNLFVNSPEVIPDFILTLTASGKLSRKAMPISKFNEIYQDYVCGCLLRIGREIMAYLPVEQAVVNAISSLLNSATGLLEDQVIVSAAIPRATLGRLNFSTLDPS
nr:hypothetical protein [Tanacetum cinerariifolium]